MKKTLLSSLAVLAAATAFAGTGTQADPYTVDEVIAMGPDASVTGVYVKGYIVGTIPEGAASTVMQYATFTAANASNTNMVMAGTSGEDDYNYCIPVQLTTSVRDALSVQKNPNNIGHELIIGGDIIKYCGAIGVKNTNFYEWIGEAPTPGGGSTGGGTTTPSGNGYLTSNYDGWEILDVVIPSEAEYIWSGKEYNGNWYMNASAFIANVAYAAESYLISPVITLKADEKSMSFDHAAKFQTTLRELCGICIREEGATEWTSLTIPTWPAAGSWTFVNSGSIDISAYSGKKVQVAFKYGSSAQGADTWEVQNLVISTTAGGGTPSTPPTTSEVWSVSKALTEIAGGYASTAQVKGYITSIEEVSTQFGNATYNIADNAGDTNQANNLKVYRGYYLDGAKFTSADQIKVGDLVVVEGTLKMFYETPEVDTGSKIISLNGSEIPSNPGGGNDTPGELRGESVTYDFTVPSSLGNGYSDAGVSEQEEILTGVTLENGVTNLSFANNGGNNPPRLYYGSGNSAGWTMRFYKDNDMVVSVDEGYYLTGVEFNGTNIGVSWTWSNGNLASSVWTPTEDVTSVKFTKTATGSNPAIKSMKVYYSKESGVDGIEADDVAPVYYNLQGQRVLNPERGIFIMVRGNKATKVVK